MVSTEQAGVCPRTLDFQFNIAKNFFSYSRKRKRVRANISAQ